MDPSPTGGQQGRPQMVASSTTTHRVPPPSCHAQLPKSLRRLALLRLRLQLLSISPASRGWSRRSSTSLREHRWLQVHGSSAMTTTMMTTTLSRCGQTCGQMRAQSHALRQGRADIATSLGGSRGHARACNEPCPTQCFAPSPGSLTVWHAPPVSKLQLGNVVDGASWDSSLDCYRACPFARSDESARLCPSKPLSVCTATQLSVSRRWCS